MSEAVAAWGAEVVAPQALHPLDPISPEEFKRARAILEEAGHLAPGISVASVHLDEPEKKLLEGFTPTDRFERRLRVVLVDVAASQVRMAVVSVTSGNMLSWRSFDASQPPYGQPGMLAGEPPVVEELVRAHPDWRRAIAQRGITDASLSILTTMTPGFFDVASEIGIRVYRVLTLHREANEDNPWARPVDGLVVNVDMTNRRVIEVIDYGVAPIPSDPGILTNGVEGRFRQDVKPLEITQPEGASFTVEGRYVCWQKWSFRIGFDVREGLVLHQIRYDDDGRSRPIIHRASIAEMVVPYGDPHPARRWINYFDAGEYYLGRSASSLTLGCDCLGEIHYFDAVLPDDQGMPYTAGNVVCMHEEDYGVLWKHDEFFTGVSVTRRSRRLVVSFFAAIGNYDYGFFWYLYQDGTIQFEAKLTGIVFANTQLEGVVNPHAAQVAPGIVAPFHQHLFCARLHMQVDGERNRVEELDVVADQMGPDNPYGNAFRVHSTLLDRESTAARVADQAASRVWKISSTDTVNRLGQSPAYKLVPHSTPTLLANPDSPIAARAHFATKNLWVTRYRPDERYPAGDFPNQHHGGDGLPRYQVADEGLDGEDIVVWHTFGTTHITRPEDWPVMPVEYTGFTLKPVGFFNQNPAMDVPAPTPTAGHCGHVSSPPKDASTFEPT
ncbi:primary-amine oxidase [Mycolicibacterium baixiangningiae]|uniref:primary-amine oxidase n=1 Tax=Mycolicibacterium baixiangningiae TaxID=2761578 RepID=UPI0038508637